jgi:hypothetical protein
MSSRTSASVAATPLDLSCPSPRAPRAAPPDRTPAPATSSLSKLTLAPTRSPRSEAARVQDTGCDHPLVARRFGAFAVALLVVLFALPRPASSADATGVAHSLCLATHDERVPPTHPATDASSTPARLVSNLPTTLNHTQQREASALVAAHPRPASSQATAGIARTDAPTSAADLAQRPLRPTLWLRALAPSLLRSSQPGLTPRHQASRHARGAPSLSSVVSSAATHAAQDHDAGWPTAPDRTPRA